MSVNIVFREVAPIATPVTIYKNTALSNQEIDGNMKSIKDTVDNLLIGVGVSAPTAWAIDILGVADKATTRLITNDNIEPGIVYPTWSNSASGYNSGKVSSTKLFFVPSTGILSAVGFSGQLTGTASQATSANGVAITNDVTSGATVYPTWVGTAAGTQPEQTSDSKLTFLPTLGKFMATVFASPGIMPVVLHLGDDNTTNALMYPLWAPQGSGDRAPTMSTAKMSFNPSTGTLTATNMITTTQAPGTDSTAVATTAFVLAQAGNSDPVAAYTDGDPGTSDYYARMDHAHPYPYTTNDNATNASVYPVWVTASVGNLPQYASSVGMSFNPSTGVLTCTNFVGSTAAVDTNTTTVATTAFVIGQASGATPLTQATSGATGVLTRFSRADHQHPYDSITNDVATNASVFPVWVTANTGALPSYVSSTKMSFNPLTGLLTCTNFAGSTAAVDTNTTTVATTAFVVGQASASAPLRDGPTAVIGTSLRYARADHVHPLSSSAFRAYMSANQTITTGVATVLQLNTESFDIDSYYNNGTYRFTPLIAGYYRISASVLLAASTGITTSCELQIYKNSAGVCVSVFNDTNNAQDSMTLYVEDLIPFNGSTDYIEIRAIITASGVCTANGGTVGTSFVFGNLIQRT